MINEFRLYHLDGFMNLFVQVLELCGQAGLLDLEHVSLSEVPQIQQENESLFRGCAQRIQRSG